jgi:hypothetical protein
MEQNIGHKICFFHIYDFLKENFVHKYLASYAGIMCEMHTEMHADHHVKCPLFLSDFNTNRNGLTCFSKTTQYQIPLISDQLLWSCMRTDRQKDMARLRGAFFFICELTRKTGITKKRKTDSRLRSRIIFSSR